MDYYLIVFVNIAGLRYFSH